MLFLDIFNGFFIKGPSIKDITFEVEGGGDKTLIFKWF